MPCVLNAANEVANKAFRDGKIRFLDIYHLVEEAMKQHQPIENPTLEELLEIDQKTRNSVLQKV